MRDQRVVLYVKYPQPGSVKTRLADHIGRKEAADLYRQFVLDILTCLSEVNMKVCVHYLPDVTGDLIKDWLPDLFSYSAQEGDTLGERMCNSFQSEFADGAEEVVLVGSDIPQLQASFFVEAFAALQKGNIAIGPASDGGYYLIGSNKDNFRSGFFEGILWSSDSVYTETIKRIEKNNCSWIKLPMLCDIDTIEDLCWLLNKNEISNNQYSFTLNWVKKHLRDICVDSDGSNNVTIV